MDERVRGRAVEGRESSSSGSGSGESWGNLRKIFLPRLGWVWLGWTRGYVGVGIAYKTYTMPSSRLNASSISLLPSIL